METSGHPLLTALGAIEDALIRRANYSQVPYVVLVPDLQDALAAHDRGYQVMVGSLDDPDTYRAARVDHAALVAATSAPVVIIGGGRVGRAPGRVLERAGIAYKIVEQRPERIRDPARYIEGNAAELEVLRRAGLRDASAVLITTHEDDVNVYLTLCCRPHRDRGLGVGAALPQHVPHPAHPARRGCLRPQSCA